MGWGSICELVRLGLGRFGAAMVDTTVDGEGHLDGFVYELISNRFPLDAASFSHVMYVWPREPDWHAPLI